jgi:hypothetical protein
MINTTRNNVTLGMRRIQPIIFLIAAVLAVGFRVDNIEHEKYLNFIKAVENESTFSLFTVIKVRNLNTGVTKEICTKGSFIVGALHHELHANYSQLGIRKVMTFIRNKKDRYFELKDKAALKNISFGEYQTALVEKVQHKYDFNKLIEKIKLEKKLSVRLNNDDMKAFAHVLFNKGYLTGESDCWGGSLEYVDSD